MQASNDCLDLIKAFEGLRLKAYPDPESPRARLNDPALSGSPWTIGYGYTGPEVKEGVEWSESQANLALVTRVNTIARILNGCIVPALKQHQLDALVCLCYNIGQGEFRGSTLLRLLNQREWSLAAQEILKWNHVAGRIIPGLTARRQAEYALFLASPQG